VTWLPRVTALHPTLGDIAAIAVGLTVVVRLLRRLGDRLVRVLLSPLQRLSFFSAARVDLAAANLNAAFTTARTPRPAAIVLALSVVSWVLLGVSFWLVMPAFDLELPFGAGLLVAIIVSALLQHSF
jgi:uncharacterized membrane protein YbhN (UPF0104 family)